jgi:GT2 family glycosyltransferase
MKKTPNQHHALNQLKSCKANHLAVIIPTKDRPLELRNLLINLEQQSLLPEQVIIIDSGKGNSVSLATEHPKLNICYEIFYPPSAARQRNKGLKYLIPSIAYIAFFDDDIALDPSAIENAISFLEQAPPDVGAISLNLLNHPRPEFPLLKGLPIAEWLGLYSQQKGVVLRSGFQILIGTVKQPIQIELFPSGAFVCRREILSFIEFDPWFQAYSYLEDLDFSYRLGKRRKLMAIPSARFIHLESQSGKEKGFQFGQKEVLNRIYFVRKHQELSIWRCLFGLTLRAGMNLFQFTATGRVTFISRALGNFVGLARLVFHA